jgi:NHLM bacteriocin system ABC transporter peptidase/ATP-binding protein
MKTPTAHAHRVKVPTILQQAAVECGAASLGMILAHFGRWVSLEQLRSDCGVSRDGSDAINIVTAAEGYGLVGTGHRGVSGDLSGLEMPAIIWWKRSHFMVLEGVKGETYYVNDPARGRYSLTEKEFSESYSGAAITFEKTDAFQPSGHRYRATPALARRLANSRTGVTFAILAGLLAMLLGLLTAPLSQVFINDVLGAGLPGIIGALVAALLIIGLFRGGLTLVEYAVIARIQATLSISGTQKFLHRLLRLPIQFYLERSIGDLSQRVQYNGQVAQLLAGQMASAGIALIGTLGYAALLLYYNVWIGLLVLVFSLLNVVVLRTVMDRRTNAQARVIRKQNELRGTTTAAIAGIETIKASGMESDVFTSLTGQQSEYISAESALVPTTAVLAAAPILLFSLTSAAILVLGGWFTIVGTFTLGGLLAIQALAANLNSPIQTLMATGGKLQVITSSLQAIDDVQANPCASRFDPRMGTAVGKPLIGQLRLDAVTFGYSSLADPLITDFTLVLEPGQRVALVGVSGAGKTTLGNLAAGLLTPWSGQVRYDGHTSDELAPGVLEIGLAKVDQTIVIFEGSVRDNITLWDATIPDSDVRAALRDASLLDDVLARQGGLDARVLENGRNFSGGQCQRLEIARALVRNPRIMILDEATSALDDITEKQVDDALRSRGVTCLIIAHRLSTIRDADEIVVLGRGGVIEERGTHDVLLAAGGLYADMIEEAGEGGDVGS